MPGSQRQQSDLHLGHATLKEGEMRGRSMANINRWVDGDGKLIIKFLCNPGDSYGKKKHCQVTALPHVRNACLY